MARTAASGWLTVRVWPRPNHPDEPSPSWSSGNTTQLEDQARIRDQFSRLLASRAKDAGLVTFGVCQYDPGLITLANINTLCAMSHQTSHLGVLVLRPEVEMQSALSLLALIKPDEVQPRQTIRLRARVPPPAGPLPTKGKDSNNRAQALLRRSIGGRHNPNRAQAWLGS